MTTFSFVYMTLRAIEDDKGDNWWNTLKVALLMTVPMFPDLFKCLYFAPEAAHAAYNTFVASTFPYYTQMMVGIALGGMYIGNLTCALQSAKHHRAITDEQIAIIGGILTAAYVFPPIYIAVNLPGFMPALTDAILWFE